MDFAIAVHKLQAEIEDYLARDYYETVSWETQSSSYLPITLLSRSTDNRVGLCFIVAHFRTNEACPMYIDRRKDVAVRQLSGTSGGLAFNT